MKKLMGKTEFEKFLDSARPTEIGFDGASYIIHVGKKLYVAEPPFPPKEIFPPRFTLLREHLDSKPKIVVVLVHLGEYAIGLFQGTELAVYKTGKHSIRGRTRKGGSSSARYARVRARQRTEFLEGVSFAIEILLSSQAVDHIFLGGSGLTAKALVKTCPYLKRNEKKVSLRTVRARHADFETLKASIDDAWSFRVTKIP
ncbi:MAG: hypothetical protein HY366_01050 [Candidatus Aenigmarchaeota archaeon]|nr:hypothetical protein [Candidatus Aenigmarchaeota archaeon]